MKMYAPAADLFPLMGDAEFFALVEDIKTHGLREPIVLDIDGRILDGRNREKACRRASVEPRYVTYDGPDAVAYVLSENLHRRHLSESQRAMVAARVATLRREDSLKQNRSVTAKAVTATQPEVASRLNVSVDSVQRARRVIDRGTDELVQAVDAGDIPVSAAAILVEARPEDQRTIVGKVQSGAARSVTEAKRQVRKETLPERVMFPDGKYRVIYADPPWQYNDARATGDHRETTAAAQHYPTMSTSDICSLAIADLAAPDSVLFMWGTFPLLPDALAVIAAWGFKYKTAFVWSKGRGTFGHYHTADAELLFVATRGSCTPDVDKRETQVQAIPRPGAHSRKPHEFRDLIDRMYSVGPRIELFARGQLPDGWTGWGNEHE